MTGRAPQTGEKMGPSSLLQLGEVEERLDFGTLVPGEPIYYTPCPWNREHARGARFPGFPFARGYYAERKRKGRTIQGDSDLLINMKLCPMAGSMRHRADPLSAELTGRGLPQFEALCECEPECRQRMRSRKRITLPGLSIPHRADTFAITCLSLAQMSPRRISPDQRRLSNSGAYSRSIRQ